MSVYKFKLQRLLDYKTNVEEGKKNELGMAIKRLEKEKSRLCDIKLRLNETNRIFHKKASGGMTVNELKILLDYIEYYKRGIKEQKLKIRMAEDYVSTCREELIRATQEKKMIEKLKEKDFKKFLYREQKKEEKLVDDIVSFKESNNA